MRSLGFRGLGRPVQGHRARKWPSRRLSQTLSNTILGSHLLCFAVPWQITKQLKHPILQIPKEPQNPVRPQGVETQASSSLAVWLWAATSALCLLFSLPVKCDHSIPFMELLWKWTELTYGEKVSVTAKSTGSGVQQSWSKFSSAPDCLMLLGELLISLLLILLTYTSQVIIVPSPQVAGRLKRECVLAKHLLYKKCW